MHRQKSTQKRIKHNKSLSNNGREEVREGEEGRGKGRTGGAFRQIKIYDYTPGRSRAY